MIKAGGRHLIVDYWGVPSEKLVSCEEIDAVFRRGAETAGATVLSSHFHHFGDGYGITGVTILSESHMSIHTWPENNYCAIDIFMCGDCNPSTALIALDEYFESNYSKINLIERGAQ
jgi:S-adenosylmethionine decarboxylase